MGRRPKRRYSQEFTFRPKKFNFNKKKVLKEVLNWFVLILIAVIVGYSVVTFGFQTVNVVGPSMNDTLKDGQVVIVNKFTYKFNEIERYDIVAFSQVEGDDYYDIKRVIGLPGENVRIVDGYVYINGDKLTDSPYDEYILTGGIASNEISLDDDEYFVLGDNINNSEDSRYTNVGNISKTEILGKVVYIYKPESDRRKID